MKDEEFDNLKKGDLIHHPGEPENIWIVVIDDPASPIAVHGDKMVEATRLINPGNWSLKSKKKSK